jgi:hypothetical protein
MYIVVLLMLSQLISYSVIWKVLSFDFLTQFNFYIIILYYYFKYYLLFLCLLTIALLHHVFYIVVTVATSTEV